MFKVAKERKALMWTIFLLSALQMPQFALTTGIDLLHTKVFPQYDLATIQSVIMLPNLLAAAGGVVSALLIRYYIITKKSAVISGLSLLIITGLVVFVLHTQFWQIVMFSVIIGTGLGFFIPTTVSIMFDNFEEKERQFISGMSFSFVTGGCIFMSVIGGLLTTLVWYGGYIILFMAVPVLVMAIYSIPKVKKGRAFRQDSQKPMRSKLHPDVYYYSSLAFVFMLLYTVANSNLSSHLASANLGNAATTGFATAIMMAGGIVAGVLFHKASAIFKDHMITLAFVFIFIGYTLLNFFQQLLVIDFIAVFIVGMTMSMIIPQLMFDISNCVDETNSATATMVFSSIAPGVGGFVSSIVFTNLTILLGGDSTQFRFQFVGFVALAAAILIFLINVRRSKKQIPEQSHG